jgi:hypothetical protein
LDVIAAELNRKCQKMTPKPWVRVAGWKPWAIVIYNSDARQESVINWIPDSFWNWFRPRIASPDFFEYGSFTIRARTMNFWLTCKDVGNIDLGPLFHSAIDEKGRMVSTATIQYKGKNIALLRHVYDSVVKVKQYLTVVVPALECEDVELCVFDLIAPKFEEMVDPFGSYENSTHTSRCGYRGINWMFDKDLNGHEQ